MSAYAGSEWPVLQASWNELSLDTAGSPPADDGAPKVAATPAPRDPLHPTRVLIVDDEPLIADTLKRILNLNGFVAEAVYSGDAALAALPALCPDIVLSDVRMPGRNGIETGILIRNSCPSTRVVLFSGQAGVSELMDEARRSGYGFDLWPKPIHPRELIKRLRTL